jgi:hypothetical protein
MQTDIDEVIHVKLEDELVDVLLMVDDKYAQIVTYENGKKVLYLPGLPRPASRTTFTVNYLFVPSFVRPWLSLFEGSGKKADPVSSSSAE